MLKVDANTKTLVPLETSTLKKSNFQERGDLQEWILRSWGAFCSEVGMTELFLIGSEITPHDSCRDRIDILALSRDGAPIIFELKRHRDRLQLLQAISYAAMVAHWTPEHFLRQLGTKSDDETNELRLLLKDGGFELGAPEIVLIAETFDPEVILAADWLSGFHVPISAFAATLVEHRGDTLIGFDQKFPLAGLDDVYVARGGRRVVKEEGSGWDDVLGDLTFSFAKRAIAAFRRHSDGSADRRSFYSIYSGSPLGRMRINCRVNYLKVYTTDQSPEAEETLRQRLGSKFVVERWGNETTKNSGFTFKIETEQQFEKFLEAVDDTEE